jgi:hypothetical protein
METLPPHLIVESGPERGRELVIPAAGARLGRATENDISLSDPAMSRFQCRLYFRDSFLHVMDLGSTNETLVNNSPVSDTILRYGDEVLVGDSLMKVVNDGLHESQSPHPAPASEPEPPEVEPAPIIFQEDHDPEPVAQPSPPAEDHSLTDSINVDLGLGRQNIGMETDQGGERKSLLPLILVALVTMLVVVGAGLTVMISTSSPVTNDPTTAARQNRIRVAYEKVISGEGNIFRYAIRLSPDGVLEAEVHDLRQQRDITRTETLSPDRLRNLRDQLISLKDSFLSLQDTYEGLQVGDHEAFRLTVIYGREAKTVHVSNQLEPDEFREIRGLIEAFANNELGLININIPPEELRARAAESWQNAQDLYAQRDVKNENLWQASQKLKDVVFLLETIEPKPEYFEDAVLLRQEWRKQLEDKIRDLEFEAIRAMQVGDSRRAAELNRRILATFPERSHIEYKEAYNRLVQIEQEMN